MSDDTTLLVPQHSDISIETEFAHCPCFEHSEPGASIPPEWWKPPPPEPPPPTMVRVGDHGVLLLAYAYH